ncbi:predicted protein [Sclerotinia sclerotiorum 1980 UF-70]|uniref:Uncharacterized protein n=1 Tax=Sclerotinia sclerotiorum (strain ATCC 18683 / 1980 / Ss-1) TaxID=665079 RepID=A7ENY8_SCLS1|nr:predicted protein [Sclerotinia sclerotiorum 1980 UF-70]EDO04554.1 predicted protein [Sclerotinia sclerotiorum 1980 UF-70]
MVTASDQMLVLASAPPITTKTSTPLIFLDFPPELWVDGKRMYGVEVT